MDKLTVGLFGKYASNSVEVPLLKVKALLETYGATVLLGDSTSKDLSNLQMLATADDYQSLDFAVVVGGDGTLLHAARALAPYSVPIVGINLGRLGFLTDIPFDEIEQGIRAIKNGEYIIEKRTMLRTELLSNDGASNQFISLNDTVNKRKTNKRKTNKRKTIKTIKRKTNKRKLQRGGERQCIYGGPQMITILTNGIKKIILIGEHHLSKPKTEEDIKKVKKLIQTSIDENCTHFSFLIKQILEMNNDREFDLFLEITPEQYHEGSPIEASGGLRILRDFKNDNYNNLRIHWADLRSVLKSDASVYSLDISGDNIYWKIIKMYEKGKGALQQVEMFSLQDPIRPRAVDKFESIQKPIPIQKPTQESTQESAQESAQESTPEPKRKLDLPLLKTFTEMVMSDDEKIINDFNEIMLALMGVSNIKKIRKQWRREGAEGAEGAGGAGGAGETKSPSDDDFTRIFLRNTWNNYVKDTLIRSHSDIMNKLKNNIGDINIRDMRKLHNYIKLINTIIFAVVLDFYIFGRAMKDYIHDNIIIYAGSAHTRNYSSILTEHYGYEIIYEVANPNSDETDILEFDDTEIFMKF